MTCSEPGHVDSSESDKTQHCNCPEETVKQSLNPEKISDQSDVGASCKDVCHSTFWPVTYQSLLLPGDSEDSISACYLRTDPVRNNMPWSQPDGEMEGNLGTRGRITHRTAAMNYTPEQRRKMEEERMKKEEQERRKKEKEMARKEAAEKKRKRKAMQEENSKSRKRLKGTGQQAESSTKDKRWFQKLVGPPVKP